MIFTSKSINDTHDLAKKIAGKIEVGTVLALTGNLGSGKTTFVQGFARAFGVIGRIGSPTFKLVSEYNGDPHYLFHIDCYRLENITDFLNIGGEEFLMPENGVTLMEWADIIQDILPAETIFIKFLRIQDKPDSRKLLVEGFNGEI